MKTAGRARPTRALGQTRLLLGTASALVLGAWCGWVSGFHRSTSPAVASWAVTLTVIVGFDVALSARRRSMRRRDRPVGEGWPRRGASRGALLAGIAPWLALVLVVVAWDVLGLDTGPHRPHLTISALSQAYRPLSAALWLVWILAGIGYGMARTGATIPTQPVGPSQHRTQAGPLAAVVVHPGAGPALLLPASRAAGITFWIAAVVVAVLIDFAASRSDNKILRAGELVRLASQNRLVNAAIAVAWAYAGWHLFAG